MLLWDIFCFKSFPEIDKFISVSASVKFDNGSGCGSGGGGGGAESVLEFSPFTILLLSSHIFFSQVP
jgi:hypothetical protein